MKPKAENSLYKLKKEVRQILFLLIKITNQYNNGMHIEDKKIAINCYKKIAQF